MDKNITVASVNSKPVFDNNIPPPRKGKLQHLNPRHAYLVGQEDIQLAQGLGYMEVGQSCLLSNWATTSVSYIQKKLGFRFQRQQQPDGTVRIWRIK